MKQTRRLWWC